MALGRHLQESAGLKDLALGLVDTRIAIAGINDLSACLAVETRGTPVIFVLTAVQIHKLFVKAFYLHSKSRFGKERQEAPFWHGSVKHKSHLDRIDGSISPEVKGHYKSK